MSSSARAAPASSSRPTSEEPFRHLVFDIPNPGYDADELAAGTAARAGS